MLKGNRQDICLYSYVNNQTQFHVVFSYVKTVRVCFFLNATQVTLNTYCAMYESEKFKMYELISINCKNINIEKKYHRLIIELIKVHNVLPISFFDKSAVDRKLVKPHNRIHTHSRRTSSCEYFFVRILIIFSYYPEL